MPAGGRRAVRALMMLIGGCAMLTPAVPDAAAEGADDAPSGGARFSPPAGERALVTASGLAIAPASAPAEVAALIRPPIA